MAALRWWVRNISKGPHTSGGQGAWVQDVPKGVLSQAELHCIPICLIQAVSAPPQMKMSGKSPTLRDERAQRAGLHRPPYLERTHLLNEITSV